MQVIVDTKSVRKMAARVVGHANPVLADKSQALEVIAHALGYRNFDTLSGVLQKEGVTPAIERVPHLTVAQSFEMLIRARDCGDGDTGMEWAFVQVDNDFLEALFRARAACTELGLIEACVDSAPSDWDERESFGMRPRVRNWELLVGVSGFYFRGYPKHANDAVETVYVTFEAFEAALSGRLSQSSELRWEGALLVKHEDGAYEESFAHYVLDALETEADADALAEWVGMHYGANYGAASLDKRIDWVRRFLEPSEEG